MNLYGPDESIHGLPSCDFLVPTLHGILSKLSAVLLQIGHTRETIDKKGEEKSPESARAFDIRMVQSLIV